jgi:hypothetical protein
MRDGSTGADLFRIRLNKTTTGLALSTFIDGVYTTVLGFAGVYTITEPIRVRSVVNLDSRTATIHVKVGAQAELERVTVPLSASSTTWSQMAFSASNNASDWGPSDHVRFGELSLRIPNTLTYAAWRASHPGLDPSTTPAARDADNDGWDDELEFAFASSPVSPSSIPHPLEVRAGASSAEIVVDLARDSLEVPLVLEHSVDLMDWTTLGPTMLHGQPGARVVVPRPGTAAPAWFVRIRRSQ